MPKYRRKPKFVDAEQFLIEKSHPLLGEDKVINLPEGVVKKEFTDYQDPKPYYKYGLETIVGLMEIENGDYIVTDETGERFIFPEVLFNNTYELVEDKADYDRIPY